MTRPRVPSGRFTGATRQQLERIAAEVVFMGPRLFRVGDGPPEMVLSAVTAFPGEPGENARVTSLASVLYRTRYCRIDQRLPRPASREDLLEELRAANTSMAGWDRGWIVARRDETSRVVVRRGDTTRLVRAEDLRPDDRLPTAAEVDPAAEHVALRRPSEDVTSQAAFYYAIGGTLGDSCDDYLRSRFYFNLTPGAAVPWMRALTATLNRHGIPFRFKVLRHADAYVRVDSGILYVPRRCAAITAALARDVAAAQGGLGVSTPVFTQRIAPGIAYADDPPGGGSFGLDRMTRVARALVDSAASGMQAPKQRLAAIEARFRADGLDPAHPWLNPGNVPMTPMPQMKGPIGERGIGAGWLDVADRIGASLVRDAIWHRDRCTWTGWALAGAGPAAPVGIATVGGDLYSGTAGIALFLARLAVVTGDPRQRDLARAAMRHALDMHDRTQSIGAYAGLGGLLNAAGLVAEACGEDAEAACRPLVAALDTRTPTDIEVDLLSGRAGAIRALLDCAGRGWDRDGRAADAAKRFGEQMVKLASRNGDSWSWRTTTLPTRGNLLGYSHGAAGIACALDQLARATGDPGYERAAGAAWRYETAHFDAIAGNWPDFRIGDHERAAGATSEPVFNGWWCHGAPGTALGLARHLVGKSQPEVQLQTLLRVAIETTRASLGPRLNGPRLSSYCLCHGIAGNADILMQISAMSGEASIPNEVRDAAAAGAALHHLSGDWPCGVPGGHATPGLLTGLAGIGYFYLRLYDPNVPSPLAL